MASLDEAVAELTAPGARFEIEVVDIRGVPTKAFRNRLRSLRELAESAVRRRGERELLVHGATRLSYGRFFQLANSVSDVLEHEVGVTAGDRVAILSANNPAWCTAFWGAVNIDAVVVALNGWWKADEIVYGIEDSGARILVADRARLARIRDQLPRLPALDAVFLIDPAPGDLDGDPRLHHADELHARPTDRFPQVPIDEDDPAVILYTSGTTGRPKGAVATHRSWIASTHNVSGVAAVVARASPFDSAPPGRAEVRLLSVPLFHVSGAQAHLVGGLLAGWKLVMPEGGFEPTDVMRLIQDERVTAWAAVPTMVSRVCQHPDRHRYDLSSVRNIGFGGAPVPADLAGAVRETFPNVAYQSNIYGLTETSGVSTLNGGRSRLERPTSVGRALLTVDVEVRDPDGRPVPAGTIGEVCVRGPHLIAGYWNRPDATAEGPSRPGDATHEPVGRSRRAEGGETELPPGRGSPIGSRSGTIVDGWLHTGDLGYLDGDHHLHITDRARDMVIRGGENVYCVEIEDRLVSHPEVLEAAVFGVPDADLGEAVRAVVQTSPGATVTGADLRAWVAETLADFKVPSRVDVGFEPLPRNETGKVLKDQLRRREG